MQLKKLKLSGFKSFVDPTIVLFPSHRVGVVGPNGCGKSNIIDAVRWVLGESSAKTLRGENMADVIFNGSASRKPVGQASVELIFDNSAHKLTGAYSQYTEISIRRVVSRDGQSVYYLNGTRCRRKDVADIFLGTGLGACSYAIIGQNTIAHLIEAKPGELRLYIEEAAGISKYKDRRRDAQARMENTRENLARINDIREELHKQVTRLEKQAAAATQYTEWQQEVQKLQIECDALRWKQWHNALEKESVIIQTYQGQIKKIEQDLSTVAQEITTIKVQHHQTAAEHQEKQTLYYKLSVEAARLKETITHHNTQRQEQEKELTQIITELDFVLLQLRQEEDQRLKLNETLQMLEPELTQLSTHKALSEKALLQVETDKQVWQRNWEQWNQAFFQYTQQAKIAQTELNHVQNALQTALNKRSSLQEELKTLNPMSKVEEEVEKLQVEERKAQEELTALKQALENCDKTCHFQRIHNEEKRVEADQLKKHIQQKQGELAALHALQAATLGKKNEHIQSWLKNHKWEHLSRLAETIEVEAGWEKAVERILEPLLQGICVPHFDTLGSLEALFSTLTQGECSLINTQWKATQPLLLDDKNTHLINKIQQPPDALKIILKNIYVAEDLAQAQDMLPLLEDDASVITRDGIWLGKSWIRWHRGGKIQEGVLQREKTIKALVTEIKQQEIQWNFLHQTHEKGIATLTEYEFKRGELTEKIQQMNQKKLHCNAQISIKKHEMDHLQQRHTTLEKALSDQEVLLEELHKQLESLQQKCLTASHNVNEHELQRETWSASKKKLEEQQEEARVKAQHDRERWHTCEVKLMQLKEQLVALQKNSLRTQEQIERLENRKKEKLLLLEKETLTADLTLQLEMTLQKHDALAVELKELQQHLDSLNQQLQQAEKNHTARENEVREKQTYLEKKRLEAQTLKVKCEHIEETLLPLGIPLVTIVDNLVVEANLASWEKRIQTRQAQIQQLGPINLAALDEFQSESERKKVLDDQYTDLTQALEMLLEAIKQIDEETRTRFQETYNKVNAAFQVLFPRLFGGGRASMELNHSDCLEAGISIMAQPPGKRNTSIYLLSGGEKAMTAVALVFAIFQLNPSPFCLLDEVDAPLDDSNVHRFCAMVKEMSESVQFIFITHNKITMELATHLSGVTMHEPGISRIVTVDVEEAISLAQA